LNGVVTVNPSVGRDDRAVALHSDGTSIWIVGYAELAGAGDFCWRIEKRDYTNGTLITGFGTNGVYISDPSTRDDRPVALAWDNTNLYVVGYDESPGAGDFRWRIEKIGKISGALDGTFGATTGVVTFDAASGGDEQATAVTHDGTNLYVAGWDDANGATDAQWRIEAIDLTNGNAVAGFGTSGSEVWNPSAGEDRPAAIVQDGTNLYIAGRDASQGGSDYQWHIEKRLLTTGAIVTGFGTAGVVLVNPTAGDDRCALRLDGATLYVFGTAGAGGTDANWLIEAFGTTNGQLVTGFASGGVLSVNPSNGNDELATFDVINATRFALAGTDATNGPTDTRWRMDLRAK
jgi:hypothetical protein